MDLTPWLDIQNYKMNRADVFTTWTDGNHVDHRVVFRTRISGQLRLGFEKAEDYSGFIAVLASQKTTDGYYPVTVYCSNTGTIETFDAFIDNEDEDKWDLVGGTQWQVQTLRISER